MYGVALFCITELRFNNGTLPPSERARLHDYVTGVMQRFSEDPRIVLWDIYNEPTFPATRSLLDAAWQWARETRVSQPLTGCYFGAAAEYRQIQAEKSDILSYHCYATTDQQACVDELRQAYPERPMICTEFMGRPFSTFAECLPILKKNQVGAVCWGLVNGKSGTVWGWPTKRVLERLANQGAWNWEDIKCQYGIDQPPAGENYPEPELWFHDILRVDGSPFDADEISFLKQTTA